jgi:hypothetical protein
MGSLQRMSRLSYFLKTNIKNGTAGVKGKRGKLGKAGWLNVTVVRAGK